MRKVLFIILPVVVLALGASGGWYWWNVLRFLQSTDDAYVQSDISLISPKVEGYLKEVRVADNQEVAEGDVLFVIDDRDFAAKVAQAEAAVTTEEESRREQARATLQLARNDLDNTVIRAPVSGVAGNRAGQVGQYVKAGTQLLSLVPLSRVYVSANFKETQLTHMRPGQLAEVSVDAYPDLVIDGRIESFAPASGAQFSLLPPDNATGNFTKIVQRVPVRVALPADSPLTGRLRPGLSVTVTIDTRDNGDGDGLVGAAQAKSPNPAAAQ